MHARNRDMQTTSNIIYSDGGGYTAYYVYLAEKPLMNRSEPITSERTAVMMTADPPRRTANACKSGEQNAHQLGDHVDRFRLPGYLRRKRITSTTYLELLRGVLAAR